MAPAEKDHRLSGSEPPRAPLTDLEATITLHQIRWELKAMREDQRRELEAVRTDLKTAKDNDSRFEKMEHDFKYVKWAVGIAVGAAIVGMVTGIMGRISWRDAPPAAAMQNPADRFGADRIAPPTPPALRGP